MVMKKIIMGKIGRKLFITYMVIGIIPLLSLITYSFRQNLVRLEQESISSLNTYATEKEHEISSKLDVYKDSMSRIIYNININCIFTTDDKIKQNDLISKYLVSQVNITQSLDNTIQNIIIYADGDFSSWNIKDINDLIHRDFYYDAIKNESSIIVTDSQIIYTRKFSSLYKGSEHCVLTFYIDRKLFFYKINFASQNTGLIINDRNGDILFHRGINQTSSLQQQTPPQLLFKHDNLITVDGHEFLAGASQSNSIGWKVISYDEKQKLFLPKNILYIAIQFVSISIVIIILSYFFVKRIRIPITQLNNKMKQVGNGNYEPLTGVFQNDEFGEMKQHFNSMVNRISNLIEVELKQKIKLRDSQLQILHAQISPHFLYNTLSTINMRAILLGSDEISILVKSLATFYQTSLNHGELVISIENELLNLKAYMNIQEIMHDNSFDVFYDIDVEIETHSIANFVLQPLAENAIEHGVEMIDERGIIAFTGKVIGDTIRISVEDNGPGFENGFPSLSSKGKGYGIYNVDKRIKLLFGEDYGLAITESVLGGARFEIQIPL